MRAEPVITAKLTLKSRGHESYVLDGADWATSEHSLEDLALACPNQFDAGSCLLMANTGAMEVLMNQHTPADQIAYEGDTDLSERYLMIAQDKVTSVSVPYFLTDIMYAYGVFGGSLLDRDFPFIAGWCKDTASGGVTLADANDPDKYLSLMVNWFGDFPANYKDLLVPTPAVERTFIGVDPKRDDNSWGRVALFNDDTIERIKHEVRTKKSPVLVVYNHYLYWHTNVILGYDDEADSDGCAVIQDMMDYYKQQGVSSYATAIQKHMDENGGCSDKGVFYVRDSIYDGGADEPMYDYSTDEVSVQPEKRSKRIIELPYDWAKYVGNHVYTMQRK